MREELEELQSRYDLATQMRDRLHRTKETEQMIRLSQEIGYLSRRITTVRRQLEKTNNHPYV